MKKRLAILAVSSAVTAAAALSGCSGAAVGGSTSSTGHVDKIIIGSLHPTTGSSAADGQAMDNGAQMAVDAINASGGIKSLGGAKLQLDKGDTQGKPDVATTEANRMIADGASAIIGTYSSGVSQQVAAVAEKAATPLVMDVTSADSILQQGYKYSFRIQPNASTMGTQGADALYSIAQKSGTPITKVAYLYESSAFGTTMEAAFAKEAAAKGFAVDTAIKYDAASLTDATTQVKQVQNAGDTVMVVSGYYADSLTISKAVSSTGIALDAVFGVGNGAYDQNTFLADAPKGGEKYFNTNYRISKDAAGTKFSTDYQAKYGTAVRTSAGLSYDAVQVIATALESSGTTDKAALRDAIAKESSYTGVVFGNGPITFSSTGENTNAASVVTQIINGNVSVVYPSSEATTSAVYPAK